DNEEIGAMFSQIVLHDAQGASGLPKKIPATLQNKRSSTPQLVALAILQCDSTRAEHTKPMSTPTIPTVVLTARIVPTHTQPIPRHSKLLMSAAETPTITSGSLVHQESRAKASDERCRALFSLSTASPVRDRVDSR